MSKKIKNYYGLLIIAILIQLVNTVYNLSQNIAYGQNIKALQIEKSQLLSRESQLDQALSQEIAIHRLNQNENYIDIQNLIVVKIKNNALALR